jgi:predicted metallo-beta-lactamase superfamily hydrolase
MNKTKKQNVRRKQQQRRRRQESHAPNTTVNTRFCTVKVRFSSNVTMMRVSSPLTHGSVRSGSSQYSRKDAAKSMVVSCASCTWV